MSAYEPQPGPFFEFDGDGLAAWFAERSRFCADCKKASDAACAWYDTTGMDKETYGKPDALAMRFMCPECAKQRAEEWER